MSVEDTFETDIADESILLAELEKIADRLWPRVEKAHAIGRTVTLKIKLGDFRILTRSRTLPHAVRERAEIIETGRALLRAQMPLPMGARLLGLGLHNLEAERDTDRVEARQFVLAI